MWIGLPFSVCGPKYAIFSFLWQEQPCFKRKSALTLEAENLIFAYKVVSNHKPGLYGCVCTCFLQASRNLSRELVSFSFPFSHDKFVKEGTNERKIEVRA